MAESKSPSDLGAHAAQRLVSLTEHVIAARTLAELGEHVLGDVAGMMGAGSVVLYVVDPRFSGPYFAQRGFRGESASEIESLCARQYDQVRGQAGWQRFRAPGGAPQEDAADLMLHALEADEGCVGLVGIAAGDGTLGISTEIIAGLPRLLAGAIVRLAERLESEKKISHLNTYLTVSSMLAQSLDLGELLDTALYCCMEAVSAEAASVLLLDEQRKNFGFYQVGGPAKPALEGVTFPVDQGLAGSVLKTQQAEIINDVQSDSRFLGRVDAQSGFRTRNIIAIPLVAGEEQIGVLEVLNKTQGGAFVDDDLLVLLSIAEEIAFAIRNAKVFEYVVNTYCLQRQGIMSCKGCKRPLGSWTPCVKYRQAGATS